MVNAHLPLKCPDSLPHCGIFKLIRDVNCYCHFVTIPKMFCLKISYEYHEWNKNYGGVKNGMLYSENAKIINKRLTISVTDMKHLVRQNHFGTEK